MKRIAAALTLSALFLGVFPPLLPAGDESSGREIAPIDALDPWADARRPISNPTHFDLAIPSTQLHPLIIHNEMPGLVDTILGPVPLGGSFQVYAVQFEYAFNERLSLNATKDGYIDFNPDATLAKDSGWANLAAGLKYAWLYRPENTLASNIQLLYEIPMGNRGVWQGEGDGVFIPSVSTLKLAGPWQLASQFGFKLPVDGGAESTMFYTSGGVSYQLTDWLFPTVEVSWFKVLDEGDGGSRFPSQLGGALPSVVAFEAGDLVNWGASNAGLNSSLVTLAIGTRLRCPDQPWDLGVAWEFPLTDENSSLMENRFIFDLVWRF